MRSKSWITGSLAALLLLGGAWSARSAPSIASRGLLRPDAQIVLIAQASGIVTDVPHLTGDRIAEGGAVVRIDDTEARSVVRLAEADLESARLGLKKVRDGARPEDIAKAKAGYAEAIAGLALAEKALAADEELYAQGLVSALSRQRSERALDQAKAIVETRRLDLALMEKGARAEDVRMTEIEVERRELALAQRKRALARTVVTAQREGTASLMRVHVTEGQWLDAGNPVAELAYMEVLRVDLDLPAEDAVKLERGTVAVIRSEMFPGVELRGSVESVSPVVDAAAGTIRVTVTAPNPEHALLPGIEATVELQP